MHETFNFGKAERYRQRVLILRNNKTMSWAEEQSWFGLEDLVQADKERQQEIKDNLIYNHIWTMYNDYEIHIKDMSTNHLQNCIKKCKREDWRLYALPILENELKSRM